MFSVPAAAYKLRGEYARLNFPRPQGDQGVSSGGSQQSSVDDVCVPPAQCKGRAHTSSTLDAKLQEIDYQKALQAQTVGGGKVHSPVEPVQNGKPVLQLAKSAKEEKLCSVPTAGVENHFSFRESGCTTSSSSPCQSPPDSSSASESRYASSPCSDATGLSFEDDLGFDLDDLLSGVPGTDSQLDMSWDVFQLSGNSPDPVDSETSCVDAASHHHLDVSDGCGSPQSVLEYPTSVTSTKIGERSVRKRSSAPTSATLSPPRKFNVWRHCE